MGKVTLFKEDLTALDNPGTGTCYITLDETDLRLKKVNPDGSVIDLEYAYEIANQKYYLDQVSINISDSSTLTVGNVGGAMKTQMLHVVEKFDGYTACYFEFLNSSGIRIAKPKQYTSFLAIINDVISNYQATRLIRCFALVSNTYGKLMIDVRNNSYHMLKGARNIKTKFRTLDYHSKLLANNSKYYDVNAHNLSLAFVGYLKNNGFDSNISSFSNSDLLKLFWITKDQNPSYKIYNTSSQFTSFSNWNENSGLVDFPFRKIYNSISNSLDDYDTTIHGTPSGIENGWVININRNSSISIIGQIGTIKPLRYKQMVNLFNSVVVQKVNFGSDYYGYMINQASVDTVSLFNQEEYSLQPYFYAFVKLSNQQEKILRVTNFDTNNIYQTPINTVKKMVNRGRIGNIHLEDLWSSLPKKLKDNYNRSLIKEIRFAVYNNNVFSAFSEPLLVKYRKNKLTIVAQR